MEEQYFRIWLAVLAGIAVVVLGALAVSLALADPSGPEATARDYVRLAGYGLLAISAIGLWSWRNWGFWLLGLATLVTMGADIPDGLFAAFWRAFLHLTMILLTVEQYYARTMPDEDEEEAETE